jgi:hypothetical protein
MKGIVDNEKRQCKHRCLAFLSTERTTFRLSDKDAPPPATDALENDSEIDWTKEPATERERRIRAVMLREVLSDRPSFVRLELHSLLSESATKCIHPEEAASDFREAYAKAEAISDQINAEQKKRRFERAIREVDDARE